MTDLWIQFLQHKQQKENLMRKSNAVVTVLVTCRAKVMVNEKDEFVELDEIGEIIDVCDVQEVELKH